jgi:hypothetical protein
VTVNAIFTPTPKPQQPQQMRFLKRIDAPLQTPVTRKENFAVSAPRSYLEENQVREERDAKVNRLPPPESTSLYPAQIFDIRDLTSSPQTPSPRTLSATTAAIDTLIAEITTHLSLTPDPYTENP